MMKHVFYNEGLIDLTFLHIHGLSIKDVGAIGQFGTGVKYAIAGVLRNGGKITLHRGLDTYEFDTVEREVRGQMHHRVIMADLGELGDVPQIGDLPFTTDLGKHWEPWMLFRELLSNARDEGGNYQRTGICEPQEGHTKFVVECALFDDVEREKDKYFLINSSIRSTKIASGEVIAIYKNDLHSPQKGCAFYKGIRVLDGLGCTYELFGEMWRAELSEDRQLASAYEIGLLAQKLLDSGDDSIALVNYYINTADSPEVHGLPHNVNERHHNVFVTAFRQDKLVNTMKARSIARSVISKRPTITREFTELEAKVLSRAMFHIAKMGIDMSHFEIQMLETDDITLCGMIKRSKKNIIYVTTNGMSRGLCEVIKTLLEEYIHIQYGVDDATIAFQESAHTEMLKMYSHLTNEVL